MSASTADSPELFRRHSAELRTSMPSYKLLTRFSPKILTSRGSVSFFVVTEVLVWDDDSLFFVVKENR